MSGNPLLCVTLRSLRSLTDLHSSMDFSRWTGCALRGPLEKRTLFAVHLTTSFYYLLGLPTLPRVIAPESFGR